MAQRAIKPTKEKPKRPPAVRARRPALTDEARAFIVTRLAMYHPVMEVHASVCEEFKVDISEQAVSRYNPDNAAGLSGKWTDLFRATRLTYWQDLAQRPLAYQAMRLRTLETLHDGLVSDFATASKAERAAISTELREVVAQAAKEMGGAFTNVTKHTGQVAHAHLHAEVTSEEKRNMLADRVREALAIPDGRA